MEKLDPTGWIFVKFVILGFFDNLLRKLVSLKSDNNKDRVLYMKTNAVL
jgi:hypothetical protein